ncbi:cactin [Phtheirospermum japonicum]|uniref:Cactin n=1 Tax=Phtheirospermum japonicum TaxID=374723 RepID=A0A830C7J4_9LAMI|nr:cactin [Phtheirospermum japonicum]
MPSIDRLSTLPDDLIFHILSFLPTTTSVATSILAKRWRFLWAHVPNLDLDSEVHHSVICCSDIIDKVLSLHEVQSINSFRLRFMDIFVGNEFDGWIQTLVERNVRKIDITLDYQFMCLPGHLFNCKTLVDLRLNHCGDIPDGGHIYLPALKRLHLDMVFYESDKSLPYLLLGCPVLEELIVDRFVSEPDPKVVCFYVTSSRLIKLVIRSHSCDNHYVYRVRIRTPALRYLLVKDSVSMDVSAWPLTSLTDANINLRNKAPIGGDDVYSISVLNFVCSLHNVRCLNLSTGLLKVCDSAFSTTPIKFGNLTRLELDADWGFVSYFLENADNLEVLTISKGCIGEKRWVEPCQVPTCLVSCLRTVTIEGFWCTEIEFEVTRYLLANAKVLERMGIYHQCHLKGEFERISKFERGSGACELVFH